MLGLVAIVPLEWASRLEASSSLYLTYCFRLEWSVSCWTSKICFYLSTPSDAAIPLNISVISLMPILLFHCFWDCSDSVICICTSAEIVTSAPWPTPRLINTAIDLKVNWFALTQSDITSKFASSLAQQCCWTCVNTCFCHYVKSLRSHSWLSFCSFFFELYAVNAQFSIIHHLLGFFKHF